jgi:hypothetical protein
MKYFSVQCTQIFGRALLFGGYQSLPVCPPGKSSKYGSADKSLARPGRKKATATEDFDVHISYL